jgi:hypothetical protein
MCIRHSYTVLIGKYQINKGRRQSYQISLQNKYFLFYAIKLGHFIIITLFFYVTNWVSLIMKIGKWILVGLTLGTLALRLLERRARMMFFDFFHFWIFWTQINYTFCRLRDESKINDFFNKQIRVSFTCYKLPNNNKETFICSH